MEPTRLFGERPSALPAPAALRARPLCVGFGEGNAVGAALAAGRRLADLQPAAQGCSVPTANTVSAATQPASAQQQLKFNHVKTTDLVTTIKHVTTMQINVVPAYRAGGVGGAPPRGRPI